MGLGVDFWHLLFFEMFSLGRAVLYSVCMAFPIPDTLVKILANKLVNKLAKNLPTD